MSDFGRKQSAVHHWKNSNKYNYNYVHVIECNVIERSPSNASG